MWAGILLGIAQGVFWLLPEVSISPELPLNRNPFSAPFIVQNSGQFPIHNVDTSCVVNELLDFDDELQQGNNFAQYLDSVPVLAVEAQEVVPIQAGARSG